jgi:hypothetical protein
LTKQIPIAGSSVRDKKIIEDGVERIINHDPPKKKKNVISKSQEESIVIKKKIIVPTEVQVVTSTEDNEKLTGIHQNRYYQPDPLTSHNLPAGVTMDCYGVRKTGGKFPEVPNKLSQDEFVSMLNKYKPKIKFHNKHKNLRSMINNMPSEDRKKFMEEHPGSQEPFRLTQIFELKDSDSEIIFPVKPPSKDKIINRFTKPNQSMVKTTIDWKKRTDKVKINNLKEFNIDNFIPEDPEIMYEVFNYYNGNENGFVTPNHAAGKLPHNLHQNKEKDKSQMKKNPRERINRDILANKKKTVTIVAKEKAEVKSENAKISTKMSLVR